MCAATERTCESSRMIDSGRVIQTINRDWSNGGSQAVQRRTPVNRENRTGSTSDILRVGVRWGPHHRSLPRSPLAGSCKCLAEGEPRVAMPWRTRSSIETLGIAGTVRNHNGKRLRSGEAQVHGATHDGGSCRYTRPETGEPVVCTIRNHLGSGDTALILSTGAALDGPVANEDERRSE